MKLSLVRHLWGVDLSKDYVPYIAEWHKVGYTALEASARLVPDFHELRRVLDGEGFRWVPQIFSNMFAGSGSVALHLESLREQIEQCSGASPLFFNAHSGSDAWTLDEAAVSTGWAASSALAGCVIGAVLAGKGSDLYGRRRMLLIAGICFLTSAIGTAAAPTFAVFVVFRILGGVGIGAASVASPLYIGESAPAKWRGRLVALNQLAIVFGMLIIYTVNYHIHLSGSLKWNQNVG